MIPNKVLKFYRFYIKPALTLVATSLVVLMSIVFSFVFVFGLIAMIMAVDAFVLTHLWPIVIPVLLPGLVAQGLVAATVDFYTMFWFIAILLVLRPVNISNLFSKTTKKEKKDGNK